MKTISLDPQINFDKPVSIDILDFTEIEHFVNHPDEYGQKASCSLKDNRRGG